MTDGYSTFDIHALTRASAHYQSAVFRQETVALQAQLEASGVRGNGSSE
jgi:hypothetical protein